MQSNPILCFVFVLQSTLFQNPGAGPLRWTKTDGARKSLWLILDILCCVDWMAFFRSWEEWHKQTDRHSHRHKCRNINFLKNITNPYTLQGCSGWPLPVYPLPLPVLLWLQLDYLHFSLPLKLKLKILIVVSCCLLFLGLLIGLLHCLDIYSYPSQYKWEAWKTVKWTSWYRHGLIVFTWTHDINKLT